MLSTGFDYLVRKDNEVTKVTLEQLAIDDAASGALGAFAIGRITAGDTGTVENLQLMKVDRQWTDDVVNALLSLAPYRPSLPPPAAAPGQAIVPFEKIIVDRLKLHLPGKVDAALALSDLKLVVERDASGAMQALTASAAVAVPPDLLEIDPLNMVRDYLVSTSSDALRFSVRAHARYFSDDGIENFDKLELIAPGVGTVKARMQTRNMASLLNMLLYGPAELPEPMLSHFHLEYQDAGLLAYLLSNRYARSQEMSDTLTRIVDRFPIESDRPRLRREVNRFRWAPGSIVLDVAADRFLTSEELDRTETIQNGDLRVTLKFMER